MIKISIKKTLLLLVVVGVIAAGVGWYLIQQKLAPTETYIKNCNKARLIYEQLVEFEKDYLELPSAETKDDDEMSSLDLSTANGYLGQLIIASARDSEEMFFIEGSAICLGDGPDNVVTPRKDVLRPGENGWAYFKGRDLAQEKSLPLLVPGWNPKIKTWDDNIWKTGIPVLAIDGSVTLYQAPNDGQKEEYITKKTDAPFKKDDPNLIQPASK